MKEIDTKEWKKLKGNKYTPTARSNSQCFRVDSFLVVVGGHGPDGVLQDGGIFDTCKND